MAYYITFDFGSSNSGAVLNTVDGASYNPSDLIYIHRQDDEDGFTKQPTVFWIKRELLNLNVSSYEQFLKIYSAVFWEKERYAENANFIWCVEQTKKMIQILSSNSDWVCFRQPKMALYNDKRDPVNITIKGSDGNEYKLSTILTIFFSVIKKECFHAASRTQLVLNESDIKWAITVPGLGIWHQKSVEAMRTYAKNAFGTEVSLFSEPECALIGVNLAGNADVDFLPERYSLVADLGGGTADITVVKETLQSDGTQTFDEIKVTSTQHDATISERAGGNDIDNRFHMFFTTTIAGDDLELCDSASELLWNDFIRTEPRGSFSFDKAWHALQFSDEIMENNEIEFCPGRDYMNWLKTHYPHIVNKSDFGAFTLDSKQLYKKVLEPVYKIILKSLEGILVRFQQEYKDLSIVYFAGGLSRDKHLKQLIKEIVNKRFPYISYKELSDGSTVGAIQRGGNHIAVFPYLMRRMSRRTYYVSFAVEYKGSNSAFKNELKAVTRVYYDKLGMWISDEEFNTAFNEQSSRMYINYSDSSISYLVPLCLKFAPISKLQTFGIQPFQKGRTAVRVKLYSSDKNLLLFPGEYEDLKFEGEFSYEFGHVWESAELMFDTLSNAVEGAAIFQLNDSNHKQLYSFNVKNVSKRGY